jgi:hypothetical protein
MRLKIGPLARIERPAQPECDENEALAFVLACSLRQARGSNLKEEVRSN